MKVVAHRGLSQLCGDNTLLAFQKAVECGTFDALEMDIQLDNCNDGNHEPRVLNNYLRSKNYYNSKKNGRQSSNKLL